MKKTICILLFAFLTFYIFVGCDELEKSKNNISDTSIIVNSSKESIEDANDSSTWLPCESSEKTFRIIYQAPEYSDVVLDVIGSFFEDDNYIYYFGSYLDLEAYLVEYSNGTTETITLALKNGNIAIEDLDRFGILYSKYPRNNSAPSE